MDETYVRPPLPSLLEKLSGGKFHDSRSVAVWLVDPCHALTMWLTLIMGTVQMTLNKDTRFQTWPWLDVQLKDNTGLFSFHSLRPTLVMSLISFEDNSMISGLHSPKQMNRCKNWKRMLFLKPRTLSSIVLRNELQFNLNQNSFDSGKNPWLFHYC